MSLYLFPMRSRKIRVMSLLDLCPAGSILLEEPRPQEIKADATAEQALRDKILADCLPAQREFLADEEHRILAYIGGFGSGKSWALAAKTSSLPCVIQGRRSWLASLCSPWCARC